MASRAAEKKIQTDSKDHVAEGEIETKEERRQTLGGIAKGKTTDFINPLVIARKTSGEVRIYLDARGPNDRMASDHEKPISVDELLAEVDQSEIYSMIDMSKAFWEIKLDDESKRYTGFVFQGRPYVFVLLPFGLKISGVKFTRILRRFLGALLFRKDLPSRHPNTQSDATRTFRNNKAGVERFDLERRHHQHREMRVDTNFGRIR